MANEVTNTITTQVFAEPDKASFEKVGRELEKSLGSGASKALKSITTKSGKAAKAVKGASISNHSPVKSAQEKWRQDDIKRIQENSYKIPKVESLKTGTPKGNTSPDISSLSKITSIASKVGGITSKIGSFSLGAVQKSIKKVAEVAAMAGKSVLKFSGNLVKLAGSAIIPKKALDGLSKKIAYLKKAIVRIITYRGIRAVMSYINTSIKTGTSNLYHFAESIRASFEGVMDKIQTSLTYGTNAVGAFAGSLLTSLEPAITKIIDGLAEAFNYLSMFVAKMSGASVYTKAVKAVQSYGDAIDSASKKQKDLFGFDELNRLSGDDTSNYSSMFETVAFETFEAGNIIDDFATSINDWVNNFDISSVATNVGNTLNSITSKINEFTAKVSFEGMGSKIAEGFNTLADTINPEELGKAISQKINIAIEFVKGFVDKLDWSGLGKWLANTVGAWLNGINWSGAEKALSKGINGLVSFCQSFIDKVPHNGIVEKVTGFINNVVDDVNWIKAGLMFSSGVNRIIDSCASFITYLDTTKLVTSIATFINKLVGKINWIKAATLMFSGINKVIDLCKTFITHLEVSEIASKIGDFFRRIVNGIDWDNAGSLFSEGVNKIIEFCSSFIESFEGTNVISGITTFINNLIENINWAGLGEFISNFVKNLVEDVETLFSKINWEQVGNAIYELLASIDWIGIFTDLASVIWSAVKAMLQVLGGFATGVDTKQVLSNREQAARTNTTPQHIDSEPGQGTNKTNDTVFDIDPNEYANAIQATAEAINKIGNAAESIVTDKDKFKFLQADRMATGGVPSTGSLFWAGEAGPELVTQVGSRTTVFNEGQLAGMLASSNGAVVSAILSAATELISAVNSKDTSISLDGNVLARALNKPLQRESRLQGTSVIAGV